MRIIYTGIQKENYDEKRGFSFEHNNFYLTLKNMAGVDVVEYPYDDILRVGKDAWNRKLLELVQSEKPDLFFAFMFSEELDAGILDKIKNITKSVAWFADDHWRLWNYSYRWAPHFTRAVTTWSRAPEIYARYGVKNVIRSQWASNPALWKPMEVPPDIGVSFVGQRNSARAKIVDYLRRVGMNVFVRGFGWPEGRLARDEMVRTFCRSRINLNFNNPPERWQPRLLARLLFRRELNRIMPDFRNLPDNVRSWLNMSIPQIKARPFELSACGSFVISGYADDMENYYKENEEMVFYRSPDDLVEKVKYYLAHDKERQDIARKGHERTMREHTYEKRFQDIFAKVGV